MSSRHYGTGAWGKQAMSKGARSRQKARRVRERKRNAEMRRVVEGTLKTERHIVGCRALFFEGCTCPF